MSASHAAGDAVTVLSGETEAEFEPKIVAFLCNWCSYAGADLAGVSRLQYPPNIRIIRVMCSGRVSPMLVLRALKDGADGVLVSGCHPGDCHYLKGNLYTRRNLQLLKSMLEYLGIESDRFQMSWVSASEGGKFADVVKTTVEKVRKLGPNTKFRPKDDQDRSGGAT